MDIQFQPREEARFLTAARARDLSAAAIVRETLAEIRTEAVGEPGGDVPHFRARVIREEP